MIILVAAVFIRYILDSALTPFGFTTRTLSPLQWSESAEDAAVVTGLGQENQTLLNRFTRW